MIGLEQAGITETMDFLLHKYNDNNQKLLCQVKPFDIALLL
jgi:hypothetical protein